MDAAIALYDQTGNLTQTGRVFAVDRGTIRYWVQKRDARASQMDAGGGGNADPASGG